jgi:hypothetical protein
MACCSYNVMLYTSWPVLKQGPFYDAFTVNSATFITFVVGLTDCSRIAKEKITDIVATHGEDSPRFIPLPDRRSTKSSRTPAMALVTFPSSTIPRQPCSL